MEKAYIENLAAVAGVGGNRISSRNLSILRVKYHLTDAEAEEMRAYCHTNGIEIYEEVEKKVEVAERKSEKEPIKYTVPTEEERRQRKKVRLIAKEIMRRASLRARKQAQGRGWLCGTYTSKIREHIEGVVMHKFDESEMDYIIDHLPTDLDACEETSFQMVDTDDVQRIMQYNEELNRMIPRLYINRFDSGLFED